MCKHKFKFLRQSMVLYKNEMVEIDVWECVNCNRLQIIDIKNSKIISLGGRIGEEIKYDR